MTDSITKRAAPEASLTHHEAPRVLKANREVTTAEIDGGARDLGFQVHGGARACRLGQKDREGGSRGLYRRLGRPQCGP
jgi:hypothetical protein